MTVPLLTSVLGDHYTGMKYYRARPLAAPPEAVFRLTLNGLRPESGACCQGHNSTQNVYANEVATRRPVRERT
jgi:hypothetical protein